MILISLYIFPLFFRGEKPLGHHQTKASYYGRKLKTLQDLTQQIENAVNMIPSATIPLVCSSVLNFCRKCIAVNGDHFVHLRHRTMEELCTHFFFYKTQLLKL